MIFSVAMWLTGCFYGYQGVASMLLRLPWCCYCCQDVVMFARVLLCVCQGVVIVARVLLCVARV